MASALIYARGTVSGNQPRIQRLFEDAGQTYLIGVPLQLNAGNGMLQIWDGVTIANGIAGISQDFALNKLVAGAVTNQTFGSVPNEPLARNISRPLFNDGKTGITLAIPDIVYYGQCGPLQAVAATDIGLIYGMTVDADNHWYVDKTKVGVAAVCKIVGFDAYDTTRGFLFSFLSTVGQLPA